MDKKANVAATVASLNKQAERAYEAGQFERARRIWQEAKEWESMTDEEIEQMEEWAVSEEEDQRPEVNKAIAEFQQCKRNASGSVNENSRHAVKKRLVSALVVSGMEYQQAWELAHNLGREYAK